MCHRRKQKCAPGPPGVAFGPCGKSGLACSFVSSANSSAASSTRSLKRSQGGDRAPSSSPSKRVRPSPVGASPAATAPLPAPSLPAGTDSLEALLFGLPFVPHDGSPDSPLPAYFTWRAELASSAFEYCASSNQLGRLRAALALAESRMRHARQRYDSAVVGLTPLAQQVFPNISVSGHTPASIVGFASSYPLGGVVTPAVVPPAAVPPAVVPPAVVPPAGGPPFSARAKGKGRAVAPSNSGLESEGDSSEHPSSWGGIGRRGSSPGADGSEYAA